MTLKEYKAKHGLLLDDLAAELGISRTHLCDLINHKRGCSLALAVEIEDYTGGKVKPRDLLPPPTQ